MQCARRQLMIGMNDLRHSIELSSFSLLSEKLRISETAVVAPRCSSQCCLCFSQCPDRCCETLAGHWPPQEQRPLPAQKKSFMTSLSCASSCKQLDCALLYYMYIISPLDLLVYHRDSQCAADQGSTWLRNMSTISMIQPRIVSYTWNTQKDPGYNTNECDSIH